MSKRKSKLRKWREEKGWSLGEVAGLCGMTKAALSFYENGHRRPSADIKIEMARRLGAHVGDLFDVEPIDGDEAA